MKKVFTGLLSLLLAFGVFMDSASILAVTDEAAIKESYEKVRTYYQNGEKVLYSADDVFAVASLDLDVKGTFTLYEDMLKQDFSVMPTGTLSKNIISFILMGIDPRNVNGFNLVEILESRVSETGTIKDADSKILEPNYVSWSLFALEVIDSDLVYLVADQLASVQMENGAFWYEYNGKNADESITGWVIEALSLVDKTKYESTIEKAITYLNGVQAVDGSWGAWGASPDTQAAVLEGLLAYDADGVKNGKYDKDGVSPYNTLLSFQDEAGWFGIKNWQTNNFEFSAMTTFAAGHSIGSYVNGSFVLKANQAYKQLLAPTPSVPEIVVEKTIAPVTGDANDVFALFTLLVSSFAVALIAGRNYAKVH